MLSRLPLPLPWSADTQWGQDREASMDRETSFAPNEADYVAANRAWQLYNLTVPRMRWLYVAMAALMLLVTASASIWGDWQSVLYIGGGIALLAGIQLINWFLVPRAVRRMLDQRPSLLSPNHIAWDERGLEATSDAGVSRVRWRELHRWFEGKHGLVLLLSDRLMLILPARALTDAQARDLRATLLAHGRHSANGAAS
jgi:hypothetical protein